MRQARKPYKKIAARLRCEKHGGGQFDKIVCYAECIVWRDTDTMMLIALNALACKTPVIEERLAGRYTVGSRIGRSKLALGIFA